LKQRLQQICHFLAKDRELRTSLDKLDIRLLDCLQKDNLQTADQLASRVGRSPSALARRLRRLRAVGAVAADVSLVSEDAAGYPLFAVVHIQLERHSPQAIDLFRRRLIASDNVQLCLEISGAFDIMLLIVAADMDAFNLFANNLLAEQPAVRRFETSFVKKRAKATLALPLEQLLERFPLR
jgi:Lrp/AsnC family transcriptional regulator, leucine-responsive regulatory protein